MEGWKKRFQSFQRCVAGFFRDRIEPSSCRARSSSSCVCKNPSNRFSLRSRGSAHRICQVSRTLIRALLSLPRFLSRCYTARVADSQAPPEPKPANILNCLAVFSKPLPQPLFFFFHHFCFDTKGLRLVRGSRVEFEI